LPQPLPVEVKVAHKTGELPKLRNDAGVVFARSGPYVFVALVGGADSDRDARRAIVGLSEAAYAQFEGRPIRNIEGLAPRLAEEVFRLPNDHGQLLVLENAWAVTSLVTDAGIKLYDLAGPVAFRDEALPDLLALQQTAEAFTFAL
jgi:hypothetical protein